MAVKMYQTESESLNCSSKSSQVKLEPNGNRLHTTGPIYKHCFLYTLDIGHFWEDQISFQNTKF